jgi:hypothetical protein
MGQGSPLFLGSLFSVSDGDAEGGKTYAEVAHKRIFRRWEKLREWIAAGRDLLAWRSGLFCSSHDIQVGDGRGHDGHLLQLVDVTASR